MILKEVPSWNPFKPLLYPKEEIYTQKLRPSPRAPASLSGVCWPSGGGPSKETPLGQYYYINHMRILRENKREREKESESERKAKREREGRDLIDLSG